MRPQRRAVATIDQLHGDAHLIARAAHAALQHVPHVQLLRYRRNVDRLVLVRKRGRACDHGQWLDLRQHVQDFLGHPVREVLLLRIPAQVLKRQHSDRVLRRTRLPPLIVGEHQQARRQHGDHQQIEATSGDVRDRLAARHVLLETDSFRCQLVEPRQEQRDRTADDQQREYHRPRHARQ